MNTYRLAQSCVPLLSLALLAFFTSELSPEGSRAATVSRDTPQRFLSLVVE